MRPVGQFRGRQTSSCSNPNSHPLATKAKKESGLTGENEVRSAALPVAESVAAEGSVVADLRLF